MSYVVCSILIKLSDTEKTTALIAVTNLKASHVMWVSVTISWRVVRLWMEETASRFRR